MSLSEISNDHLNNVLKGVNEQGLEFNYASEEATVISRGGEFSSCWWGGVVQKLTGLH